MREDPNLIFPLDIHCDRKKIFFEVSWIRFQCWTSRTIEVVQNLQLYNVVVHWNSQPSRPGNNALLPWIVSQGCAFGVPALGCMIAMHMCSTLNSMFGHTVSVCPFSSQGKVMQMTLVLPQQRKPRTIPPGRWKRWVTIADEDSVTTTPCCMCLSSVDV